MASNKLPLETRYALAIRRIARDYAASPDAGLSCGPRKLEVTDGNAWAADEGCFVFHFGAYGCTHVVAFGHLADALEDAAAVLPAGFFTEPDYADALADLVRDGELPADYTLARFQEEWSEGNEHVSAVWDKAQEDLTYTESGWLCSWEWTVTEIHSPEELRTWAANKD